MGLKEVREKKGMTQQELADKIGCVRQTISMIENGNNQLTVEMAKKISKVLKVKWTKLFN